MASRNIPSIAFPKPPKTYDPRYMAELTRVFVQYQQQLQNPGTGRNVNLVLTNVPAFSSTLEVGTIYVDPNGFLKIVQATNVAKVSGVSASGGVGQITKSP